MISVEKVVVIAGVFVGSGGGGGSLPRSTEVAEDLIKTNNRAAPVKLIDRTGGMPAAEGVRKDIILHQHIRMAHILQISRPPGMIHIATINNLLGSSDRKMKHHKRMKRPAETVALEKELLGSRHMQHVAPMRPPRKIVVQDENLLTPHDSKRRPAPPTLETTVPDCNIRTVKHLQPPALPGILHMKSLDCDMGNVL